MQSFPKFCSLNQQKYTDKSKISNFLHPDMHVHHRYCFPSYLNYYLRVIVL